MSQVADHRPLSLSFSPSILVSSNKSSTVTSNQAVGDTRPSFDFLRHFDARFLIDDSQSMFGNNWQMVYDALLGAALYCAKHNLDPFSVSFFHHEPTQARSNTRAYTNVRSKDAVQSIFWNARPSETKSSRPTATQLKILLEEYFTSLDDRSTGHNGTAPSTSRPLKAIIITNGIPTDDMGTLLASIDRKIVIDQTTFSPSQVSVEFWQVGSNGPTTHFFYKTGKLRGIPSTEKSTEGSPKRRGWKYDPEDPKKAGPSKNFFKFMGTNLLQSAFLRT